MLGDYLEVLDLAVIVLFNFIWSRIRHVCFVVDQSWKKRQRAELTDVILSAKCLVNDSFMKLLETTWENPLLTKSLESLTVPDSSVKSVNATTSILERVRVAIHHFPSDRFIKILTSLYKLKKSDDVANNMIEKAKFCIQNDCFRMALRSYNLALCFTTGNSRQVGRIFVERLALLSRNLKSFVQLESTTSYTHSAANFGSRIHMQKVLLSDSDRELEEYDEYLDFYDKIQGFRDDVMFSLHGERNKRIPCAADYVKMVSNEKKGRHLIVTKVLEPGTTVIVEEPYISLLNHSTGWQTKHCSKCFRKISNGIPCHGCVFFLYCSEECRSQDFQNGHKYECSCLPYAHAIKLAPQYHLGLKAICKAGPSTLYKLYMASKEPKSCRARKLLKGFDPSTGRYDSDSYYQILHLKSHQNPETINSLTFLAVSLVKVLELETTFFDQVKGTEKSGFFEFVTTALLRHLTSFEFNSFTMTGLVQNDTPANDSDFLLNKIKTMKIATGGYSLLSMMNHSCHPTVVCKNLRNGKVAVITNRRLIPGDELLFSYGSEFVISPRIERRSRLLESHRFRCNCDPCIYNWRTLSDMKLVRRYVCPDCSPKLRQSQIMEIGKCVLNYGPKVGVLICRNCGQKFKEKRLLAEVEHFVRIFENARQLVADGEVLQAIPKILLCVDYFQNVICPPARETLIAQKFLDVAFGLVVHSWLNKL